MSDFRVGDVVCDFDCKPSDGMIQHINGDTVWIEWRRGGMLDGWYNTNNLRHGTWQQNFGNLPVIKPIRKVRLWFNLTFAGYWLSYETKADAQDGAVGESFIAVAVPIEVDE